MTLKGFIPPDIARSADGRSFGRRPEELKPAVASEATVTRCSRLEFYRMLAIEVAEKSATADREQRCLLRVHLRSLQDEIARLRHRNPLAAARPSRLAWIDAWNPEE